MIHNGWMVLCLAAGSLLAVALISSTPMYTGAIMQRMLVRDLEQFQIDRNIYPGTISARYNFYNPNPDSRRVGFYTFINDSIKENLIPDLGLDVQESSRHLTLDYLLCVDPELIEDDINGALVPSGDRDALARAITGYIEDPDRRARHGKASRDRVISLFSITTMVNSYRQLYQNALGNQVT